MAFENIDEYSDMLKCILLQTGSEALKLYLRDKLKDMYSCSSNEILEIKNQSGFKQVRELAVSAPFMADKWVFVIDITSLKADVMKSLVSIIKNSTDSVFLCYCDKYAVYKSFKEKMKSEEGFLDYYVTYLRYSDMDYLYESIVPEDNRLTQKMYKEFKKGYSSDVDAVMKLFSTLKMGIEIKTKSQITDLCGIGGNTLNSFVFSLLKNAPASEKGLITTLRNRVKSVYDLKEDYTWGQLWGYCKKILENIRDIKMLLISDDIYNSVRNLPDGYDEKALMKYQRYLYLIKGIPMTRVLRVLAMLMEQRWSNEQYFLLFIYRYYRELVVAEVVKPKI